MPDKVERKCGDKARCFCGNVVVWNGRFWEHEIGPLRHMVKIVDDTEPLKKQLKKHFLFGMKIKRVW